MLKVAKCLATCVWLCASLSWCSAQAPGDANARCTVDHDRPPTYPDTVRNLMDSYHYVTLLPGNGTGNDPLEGAVWNDMSFDGNDVTDSVSPTYWQQGAGGICRFQTRVCGYRREGADQNNWLFTQHIGKDFDPNTYNYPVEIQVELVYGTVSCRDRNGCEEQFYLHNYITNSQRLPSTQGTGFMNTQRYQQFVVVSPERTSLTYTETFSFTLQSSQTGFYIGIQDNGTCVGVSRLRVYRNNCRQFQSGLVLYPHAPAPVSGSQNINIECVDNAVVSGSAQVTCGSNGRWGSENPVCQCRLGYEDRTTECVACPAGQYRSADDTTCQQCPENTVTNQVAAPLCECVDGYFRNNDNRFISQSAQPFLSPPTEQASSKCTQPPTVPLNVRLTPQQTSISVSWSPPAQTGGRSDLFYEVKRSDPDNLGSFTGTDFRSGGNRNYAFSGLTPYTDYCIRVAAHNGVSDQDPDGTHLRTEEECVRTLTGCPSAVTGVQGLYPYVVWNLPEQPNGVITGYRLTFRRGSTTRTVTTTNDQTFYVIQSTDIPWTSGSFTVTVKARTSACFGPDSQPPYTLIIDGCPLCAARSVGLVRYPTTLAPASGSVTVTTQCADNAHRISSSLSAQCSSTGAWTGNPQCECDSGYQTDTAGDGRQICETDPSVDCPMCPARIVGLVRYNATLAPASGSVTVTTQCADNARGTSSRLSLNVQCSSSGAWSGNPRCQCNAGYKEMTVDGRQTCVCSEPPDNCDCNDTSPIVEDPRLITGIYITWDTTAGYTILLFLVKDVEIQSVNVTDDYYKLERDTVEKWLNSENKDEKITCIINPKREIDRKQRDTDDNTVVFTLNDLDENIPTESDELTGTSESEVDGTAIGISIIVTFLVTAIAVGFLSIVLGLVLHTYINKKKQEKLKLTGDWPSRSGEEKARL